ncbi:MAG: DUF4321 domain-containing protein [Oscillospiraceae bacterium]|nr:DUF4321 domain-containing protein [Oscillospiraceae bacterium]
MKKGLLMFTLIMISVFLGNFIGELAAGLPGIEWLGKEYTIGFSTFDLDLQLFVLTLGLQIKVCICEIIFILISLLCYNKLAKLVIGG